MKIGMILDHTFPQDPRVKNEAEALIKNGEQVYLFCLSFDKGFKKNEMIEGINVCRYYCSWITYKFSALAYTFPFYRQLMSKKIKNFIIENQIDILHIHDIQIASSVFLANKTFNLEVVLDLHENRPEIMKEYKHVKSLIGQILINPINWKKAEERFSKESKNVVVVTELAKNELISRTGLKKEKVVVFPNTVSEKFYTDYIIDKNIINKYSNLFVLLYLGNTSKRRGIDLILDSIPEIIKQIKNFKFVVVGSSSYDKTIKEKVEKLGISNFVDLEGWKEESLFQSYIKASKIGVSPLDSNIHHDTTYANKIFQYMSLGCPVLCSDVKAQDELINKYHFGLSFNSENRRDFIKKVYLLHRDPDLRERLKKNCSNAISNHLNNSIVSKNLVKIYEKK